MKLRRVLLENVWSFLEPAELLLDGDVSIVVGPNGGGKTNLLDAVVTSLRRYVLPAWALHPAATDLLPLRRAFARTEDNQFMSLQKHHRGAQRDQFIELEIEITARDLDNMAKMADLADAYRHLFDDGLLIGAELLISTKWDLSYVPVGARLTYQIRNNVQLTNEVEPWTNMFKAYLHLFEADAALRESVGQESLSAPVLSLPIGRAASGFQGAVSLAGHNHLDFKKGIESATSRRAGNIISFAIGKTAKLHRDLLQKDNGRAQEDFQQTPNLVALTRALQSLGYSWALQSVDPYTNSYAIELGKQGSAFLAGAASSGEKEILTYLFAIYALNITDALIVIDEPELHLHPTWQKELLGIFERLARETRNQFLLATHSPSLIAPASVQYVSRVFADNQMSRIVRLNNNSLPNRRHLFAVVNSQNNEKVFFAERVILVEGISDRIFFEAVVKKLYPNRSLRERPEIIDVGGKHFFSAYQLVLTACRVPHIVIADLDYIQEIGLKALKELFITNEQKIEHDVLKNEGSKDAAALAVQVDLSISSGNLADLQKLWVYIRGRYRKLRADLNAAEVKLLSESIADLRKGGTFLLSKGRLEDYLPIGFKGKDIDAMIGLLAEDDFWEKLPDDGKVELTEIAAALVS